METMRRDLRARTKTYKTAHGCPIRLDVYPLDGVASSPILVYIHGGALIWGSRAGLVAGGARLLTELCAQAGYTQVSIDYRLAPETKLARIVEDVRDAWRWVHHELPRLFDVDTKRIAVLGRSAGGYLALMTGFCVEPRPRALVSIYGYGDITNAWCTRPSAFYLKQPLLSADEAGQVGGSSTLSEAKDSQERWRFYVHCRQQGLWCQTVTGVDPGSNPAALRAYRPICNLSPAYPPTLLIHGTDDTDVPYQESVRMFEALRVRGLEAELVTIAQGEHGFDDQVSSSDLMASSPSPGAASFHRIVRFLGVHLG
jgi:acetyl esterase/lipase